MGRWNNMNKNAMIKDSQKVVKNIINNSKEQYAIKCKECQYNNKGFCSAYGKWCYIANDKGKCRKQKLNTVNEV